MFITYPINDSYVKALCNIFHKELPDFEAETSTTKFTFGSFTIKPMVNAHGYRYGVWHNKKFILCIADAFDHRFCALVRDDSYITASMVTIVLKCLIAEFKQYKKDNPTIHHLVANKNDAIKAIDDIMKGSANCFTVDQMAEMAEMLYGKKNKRQFNQFGN